VGSNLADIMTLTEIKSELPKLTLGEKLELVRIINEDDGTGPKYDEWDLQMIEDGRPGGKLARLREKALAALERGECEEWP